MEIELHNHHISALYTTQLNFFNHYYSFLFRYSLLIAVSSVNLSTDSLIRITLAEIRKL